MVVSEFENVDAVFVDDTVIDPYDIAENARVLAQLDTDAIASTTAIVNTIKSFKQ